MIAPTEFKGLEPELLPLCSCAYW